jgi:hypothetical protein
VSHLQANHRTCAGATIGLRGKIAAPPIQLLAVAAQLLEPV